MYLGGLSASLNLGNRGFGCGFWVWVLVVMGALCYACRDGGRVRDFNSGAGSSKSQQDFFCTSKLAAVWFTPL